MQKKLTFWLRQLVDLKRERIEEINRSYGTTKWAEGVSENIANEIEELEEIVKKENLREEAIKNAAQPKTLQAKK